MRPDASIMPVRTRGGRGIMGAMDFTTYDTVRECCRRVLDTATKPMTVADIADEVGTTPHQAGRGLRQLEAEGAAMRKRGYGWTPDWWRAAR